METDRMSKGPRRRGAAVLLAAAMAGTLATGSLVSAQEPIELEMWSWNNEGAYPLVHEDAIVALRSRNPGVTVKRGQSNCGDAWASRTSATPTT